MRARTRLVDAALAEAQADALRLHEQLQAVIAKVPQVTDALMRTNDTAAGSIRASAVEMRAFGMASAAIMRQRGDALATEVAKVHLTTASLSTWVRVSLGVGLASLVLNVCIVAAWLLR
jgi:hypothetical protein